MDIIVANNVHFSYEDHDAATIKGISLQIKQGEWLSIVGRNGSGKSTLIKLLNGLFTPSEGSVRVLDMDHSR
jgi:ABC-type bacteriocin/lantibiotic exporter with double-glycine peptidase domain